MEYEPTHPDDRLTRLEYEMMLDEMEEERLPSFALPDDDTLAAWEREAAPGIDVDNVDDPWTEQGDVVACGMSLGEWLVAESYIRGCIAECGGAIADAFARGGV